MDDIDPTIQSLNLLASGNHGIRQFEVLGKSPCYKNWLQICGTKFEKCFEHVEHNFLINKLHIKYNKKQNISMSVPLWYDFIVYLLIIPGNTLLEYSLRGLHKKISSAFLIQSIT